ncbi:MAG: helix-turn-helix domain-containing protein [Planctomycetota bacterium]|jgi:PAS domain S-box-containing protein
MNRHPIQNPKNRKNRFFANLHGYEYLEGLFRNTPDLAFFVKDREGRFVMVNRNFLDMFGAQGEEEVLGRTDFDLSPPHLAENFVRDDRTVLDEGVEIVNRMELVNSGRGGVSWHLTNKFPLRDRAGAIVGLAGTTRDLKKSATSLKEVEQLSAALEYILERFATRIQVERLAELSNLSVSQFERRFKKLFGLTPLKYVLKVRVDAACQQLVSTRRTICRIALDTGFYDHSYFTRQFTHLIGMSPSEYRHRYREG